MESERTPERLMDYTPTGERSTGRLNFAGKSSLFNRGTERVVRSKTLVLMTVSSYLKEKTTRFHYKDQFVDAV
jgi:hypothetical protein